MKKMRSLKWKIICTTTLCVIAFGLTSSLYLYWYLSGVILEKAARIDHLYLSTIQNQLNEYLIAGENLANLAANDLVIAKCVSYSDMQSLAARKSAIKAQDTLGVYRMASPIDWYINKLLVFNKKGIAVQGVCREAGRMTDFDELKTLPIYKKALNSKAQISELSRSIAPGHPLCISIISPVYNKTSSSLQSYIYVEIVSELFTDVLRPYNQVNTVFVADPSLNPITYISDNLKELNFSNIKSDGTLNNGKNVYKLSGLPLASCGLSILSLSDITELTVDTVQTIYTFIVTALTALCIAAGLAIILSNYVTRPLKELISRIKRISENDFSYDPDTERASDEIGQIGKVINEMSVSIGNLLKETEDMYEQRRKIEIALLQSQVNPHFLYNTLDSIYWMAVIQKNTGISSITRSLSNLLKNMAKGAQDKIMLKEELSLLEDYVAIQSIRYMETFEFFNLVEEKFLKYKIVKLTLQPLVENAIFHGIEPTGKSGYIKVYAQEDEEYIKISVEDNGTGMTQQELNNLLINTIEKKSSSLNGIGIANVHTRLTLLYGKQCGLTIESEKGIFTKATVRIPKEV